MEIRPATPDETPAFMRAAIAAFHDEAHPDDVAMFASLFEPARSVAVFDGADIVATAAVYTRELTVPGAVMGIAAVTLVGVLATHRRRGLLTELMRRQLDDLRARGEPVAALWASESAIYGRYGYGLAARHASVSLRTAGARVSAGVPAASGRVRLLEPAAAVERIAPLYDRLRRDRVGHLDRTAGWWSRRVRDPEHRRDGRGPLHAAVHEDEDGAVDGYLLYAVKAAWGDGPDGQVFVRELMADGPAATAALWAYLLGLDLTRSITWDTAPSDEPLAQLVEGPQRAHVELGQNLWVRLVDVGAALAARAYAGPLDVVLEVEDPGCAWNAGRWRLRSDGAGAGDPGGLARAAGERTDAPADLALSAPALGAAYLGGTSLAALAGAGRVRELRAGAVEAAALAFRGGRDPWCPEVF